MKHLKTYEDEHFSKDFKVGDTIYCIDDTEFGSRITLGESYTIRRIVGNLIYIFPKHEPDGFYAHRFTKDPNHPILIKLMAKKYNL